MTDKLLVMTAEKIDKRIENTEVLLGAEEELGTYDEVEIAVLRARLETLNYARAAMTEVDEDYLWDVSDLHWQTAGGNSAMLDYVDSFCKFLLAHIKEGE
jgi:hypothetical protein